MQSVPITNAARVKHSRDNSNEVPDTTGKSTTPKAATQPDTPTFNKNARFWAILIALGFTGLLTALEATITSTALPSIVADLGGGDLYIWAINGYFLAMTSLQPLFGQLANVFGRRWPIVMATVAFILGSGICGGASGMGMLIAGRVIQGVGAGGITVLIEIIICDLIPLRERGTYFAIVFGIIALGTAMGPFFGGLIVEHSTWRWVFYLNLPVGACALTLLVLFLNVNYTKEVTLATRLTKIDWVGNLVFVGAISAILISLSWAGAVFAWSSYHVLVPLIIGFAGLVGFLFFERSRFAPQPTMPLRLLSNRTSATAFALTFMHSILIMWALYFLPVYFQGVLGSTAGYSGVQLLPTILAIIPSAIVGGAAMSKFGRYRPIHYMGFALIVIGFGLLTLLDENSSTGAWVGFQVIESTGTGLIIATVLPAVVAPLSEADTAVATATWAFVRSFGTTWGIAIPAAIFNNRFDQLAATRITDPAVRAQLVNGQAYSHATPLFIDTLSPTARKQFISVLSDSLRRTWQVAIAFAILGFLLVSFEKEVPLRQELETEFGMAQKGRNKSLETTQPLEKEAMCKDTLGTET